MLGEELFGPAVEVDAVVRPSEAVSLVRIEAVLDRDALVPHGEGDLVGLGLLHPGIIGALTDEERGSDAVDVVEGGD